MTPFQKEVYAALRKIPRGYVTSYGEIAMYLGSKAVRAVGTAVGKNPNAPEIPCHRVVRSSGAIGKYSGVGGVTTKIRLLEEEGIFVENAYIKDFSHCFYRFEEEYRT